MLLPFQRLQVSLGRLADGEGASEVQTLRHAEWGGGAAMLTGAALFSGFYLNELLMKLLARHDAHAALFDAYAADPARCSAEADDARTQAALRAFELTLLREVGLLPELNVVTATQEPVAASAGYALLAEAGVSRPRLPPSAGCPAPRSSACRPRSNTAASRRCSRPAQACCRRCAASCARCFTIMWARRCCARAA